MRWLIGLVLLFGLVACNQTEETEEVSKEDIVEDNKIPMKSEVNTNEQEEELIEIDLFQYSDREPVQWGEAVHGVKTRMDTDDKVIALTFDACGGPYGNGYDKKLIEFLREEEVPATLFVNERWILEHEALFLDLANDPLFQIENHGTDHVPLSVSGQIAWGIEGTNSPADVEREVMGNQETIERLTGRAPTLFRSGTAFYDEIAVELVNELGLEVVNFDILGDAGATYSAAQVHQALMGSEKGSIALLHMNQPSSGTAEGVALAVQDLRERGYSFVKLEGVDLK
ncbi:polysaccharide deacetylase family protein [Halalkalibacter kiskunsagensis]|uniref:Polysaccharide deacetylase family protein n=1 Tax=Halalkalibacter kiskunsagensis TaxID=1548599 RepID=A0ABV6KD25_9BACI